MNLNIIPRSKWLSFKPRSVTRAHHRGNPHVVHYYGSAPATPPTTTKGGIALCQSFASYHRNTLGWADIGYNWIILRDGTNGRLCTVLEGRGDNVRGAHAGNNTANGYAGVLLLASHSSGATPEQLETLKALTKLKGWGRRTGHMEWSPTSCPGPQIMDWIRRNRTDSGARSVAAQQPEAFGFEELPYNPATKEGGDGPHVTTFSKRAARDKAAAARRAAGATVTKHGTGPFYLYEWRPGTQTSSYRFGPWASKAGRDKLATGRERMTGRQMRRFQGRTSLYPYLGGEK